MHQVDDVIKNSDHMYLMKILVSMQVQYRRTDDLSGILKEFKQSDKNVCNVPYFYCVPIGIGSTYQKFHLLQNVVEWEDGNQDFRAKKSSSDLAKAL